MFAVKDYHTAQQPGHISDPSKRLLSSECITEAAIVLQLTHVAIDHLLGNHSRCWFHCLCSRAEASFELMEPHLINKDKRFVEDFRLSLVKALTPAEGQYISIEISTSPNEGINKHHLIYFSKDIDNWKSFPYRLACSVIHHNEGEAQLLKYLRDLLGRPLDTTDNDYINQENISKARERHRKLVLKNVKGEYDRKGAKAIALKNDIDALDVKKLFHEYGSVSSEEGLVMNVTLFPQYQVLMDLKIFVDLAAERFCTECMHMPRAPHYSGKCLYCYHNSQFSLTPGILQDAVVRAALNEMFGINEFRSGQLECMKMFCDGTDVSVAMPTGEGKSLIFQMPRVALNRKSVFFLIVTPLTSLCDDLLKHCLKHHIPCAAVRGSTSRTTRELIAREIYYERLSMLIIVPEMLQSRYITDMLAWLEGKGKTLKIIVDESHVTQEIGRPSYGLLANYADATFLMLSATCSPEELELMRVKFGIEDKPIFSYISPNVLPANIQYNVAKASKNDMIKSIKDFVERNIDNRAQIKAIVYANTKKECERILPLLRTEFANETIVLYHGGLDEEQRNESSRKFAGNDADIIVATWAYSLGVNVPSVRFVIHTESPGNIISILQESGRCGRDGGQAFHLLMNPASDTRIDFKTSLKEGDLYINRSRERKQRAAAKLYGASNNCRRVLFQEYFYASPQPEACKENQAKCDFCRSTKQLHDIDVTAQMKTLTELLQVSSDNNVYLSKSDLLLFMSKNGDEFAKGLKLATEIAKTKIGQVSWIPGLVSNPMKRDLVLEKLIFHGYAEEDIFEVINPNTDQKTKSRIWRSVNREVVETSKFSLAI